MFPLGLRIFHCGKMIYTTDLSITTNRATRNGMVTINDGNEVINSDLYMMVTNAAAVNGDVYEYDILQDTDDNLYIVVFDFQNGRYIGINGDNTIAITSKMFEYEIMGNPIETPELMSSISFPCEDSIIPRLIGLSEDKAASDLEDKFKMFDAELVDFDDDSMLPSDEITEEERKAMMESCVDLAELYDSETIIRSEGSCDITDEYVEMIYRQYEEQSKDIGTEEDYRRYDEPVYLYFAGSYDPLQKRGSYSIRVEWDGQIIETSNLLKNATDQKSSELQAMLNALRVVKTPSQILIYSSSKYVLFPFTKGWVYEWEKNDWMKKPGEGKIKNHTIFEKILNLVKIHEIEFVLYEDPSACTGLKICTEEAKRCFSN